MVVWRNGLQFTRSQQDAWRHVATSVVSVLSFGQRPSGLWPRPTNDEEVGYYHGGVNRVAFGDADFGSYTVTWYALLALEELFSACPQTFLRKVKRAFVQNPSIAGGYGRPERSGGRTSEKVLLASRHTAFALLIRFRYLSDYKPDEWHVSVDWLLSQQTKTGGWPYRLGSPADEPLATAACITALSYYLHLRQTQIPIDARELLIASVRRGFNALLSIRMQSGLWKGHLSGINDVTESSNILDLLLLPEVQRQLEQIDSESKLALLAIKQSLSQIAKFQGWAATWDENAELALAPTISALHAMFSHFATDDSGIQQQFLYGACDYVLKQVNHFGGGRRLFSGDWTMLGRLAAAVVSASGGQLLDEAEKYEIERKVKTVTSGKILVFKTMKLAALDFEKSSIDPILFILSEGSPNASNLLYRTTRAIIRLLPYARRYFVKFLLERHTAPAAT